MILSIDPSSSYVGIAQLEPDGSDAIIESIRFHPRTLLGRLGVMDDATQVLIEKPPPASRARHDHQAPIGYAIGRVTGIVEGWAVGTGISVDLVEVTPWRNNMLVYAARRGLVRQPPKGQRRLSVGPAPNLQRAQRLDGGGYLLTFRNCDCEVEVKGYIGLHEVGDNGCPKCRTKPGMLTDDEIRDAWKQTAYEIALHLWPQRVDWLVRDAASRAQSKKAPWLYAGVADGCEAACLGLMAVEDV